MKISIVIPAHNEESRIDLMLEEYCNFFRKLPSKENIKLELLVVLNACKDNTIEVVRKSQKKNKEIHYLDFTESGKGFAIIKGFEDALSRNNEIIGFADADMATTPKAFYELIKGLKNYDGIIASRWLPKSIIRTRQSLLRRFMSRGFNFIVRSLFFFPYTDTQCGAKVFHRRVISKIITNLGLTRWAFDVDLLYQARLSGFSIREMPTIWEDKKNTKLNIVKVPFEMFTGVIRLRLLHSPLEFIVKAYDSLPEGIKIHNIIK